ncbi:MAG: hypothetical protein J5755_00940, partial [Clostridia bacterium]|nr:hypothetical protein [Clostridia bacterium]
YFTKSLNVLGLGLALSIVYRHTVYYGVMWAGGKLEKLILGWIEAIKAKWAERKALSAPQPDGENE